MDASIREFRNTLAAEAHVYGVLLSEDALNRLSDYYQLLNLWNARLHLVAPTSPAEFATRHVLESLMLLEHLPEGAEVTDVGSGGGLPIIPCLIVRPDIRVVLIEASKKKAVFLREALSHTANADRATVTAARFEAIASPERGFITSRALERFEEMLPQLIAWAPQESQFLLFGNESIATRLEDLKLTVQTTLIPNSLRRFLITASKP